MAAYTKEIAWQAARANRGLERERETDKDIECPLALPVTTYLKFRFSWDVNSPRSELKQWKIFPNNRSRPSGISRNATTGLYLTNP